MTKLRVTTDRLNGSKKGDIIDVADASVVEYLLNSLQVERVEDAPVADVVTKVKNAATKVGRRKRKD
jgi:hypothetical protein